MTYAYTCIIHSPSEAVPASVAVACADAERAMVHAERAAAQMDDWGRIEVFLGQRIVAVRERAAQ